MNKEIYYSVTSNKWFLDVDGEGVGIFDHEVDAKKALKAITK